MTDKIKIAVFKKLLDEFETDEMRLYCEDMIKQIPDYIFLKCLVVRQGNIIIKRNVSLMGKFITLLCLEQFLIIDLV